jgi:hypothetical protein
LAAAAGACSVSNIAKLSLHPLAQRALVAELSQQSFTFLLFKRCVIFSALQVQHAAGLVLVDGWLQLRVPAVSAVLVKRLRQALEWVLLEGVAGAGGGGGQGGRRGVGGLLGREAQGVTAVLQQLLASEVK